VDDNTNPSCSTNKETSTAAPTTSGINDSSPMARSSTSGVGKIYFTKLTIAALAASVWDLFAYYHTSIFDKEYEKIISCLAVRVFSKHNINKKKAYFSYGYDPTTEPE
jgi:hypothetical protein